MVLKISFLILAIFVFAVAGPAQAQETRPRRGSVTMPTPKPKPKATPQVKRATQPAKKTIKKVTPSATPEPSDAGDATFEELEATPPQTTTGTIKTKKKRESLTFIYGSFTWLWWQEPLKLVSPSGTQSDMLTTANGPCFGGGWRKVRARSEWNFQGCFFSAANEVGLINQSTSEGLQYYQQGVESFGLVFGPGYLWRPTSGSVAVGFQLPLFLRFAQWTLPDGWDVKSAANYSGGLAIQSNWTLKRLTLAQKVGLMYNMGALWALEIDFRF
jgi:hypothetical protein